MFEFKPEDFRKSSFSGEDPSKTCVEVALVQGTPVVGIGDTKAPFGSHLTVSHAAFAALLAHGNQLTA